MSKSGIVEGLPERCGCRHSGCWPTAACRWKSITGMNCLGPWLYPVKLGTFSALCSWLVLIIHVTRGLPPSIVHYAADSLGQP